MASDFTLKGRSLLTLHDLDDGEMVALDGGASTVFTWTCTPLVAGVASLGASVAGVAFTTTPPARGR